MTIGMFFCGPCKYKREHYNGRMRAGYEVARAIKSGILTPPKTLRCADCSKPAIEYDHRDYGKPLQVDPVCSSCNSKRGPGKWVKYSPVRRSKGKLTMESIYAR